MRRPAPSGLRRARLESALADRRASPVAVVVAPAGSGKTTLMARVAHASDCQVAWYRVMPEDASPADFVSHLASALLGAGVEVGDDSLGSPDELLHRLETVSGEVLLVLDDVHEI